MIIIISNHRSGSSALAGFIHHLGFKIGRDFLEPNHGNTKGHYEDIDMVRFGESYILHRGGKWHCPWKCHGLDMPIQNEILNFKKNIQGLDGWKDPRTAVYIYSFIPFLPDKSLFIFLSRDENAVENSLIKRTPTLFINGEARRLFDFYESKTKSIKEEIKKKSMDYIDVKFPCFLRKNGFIVNYLNKRFYGKEIREENIEKARRFLDPGLVHN